VEIEYFEGGFTLKYRSCPYCKLVKTQQKTWLCNFRKKTWKYVISGVSHGKKAKSKSSNLSFKMNIHVNTPYSSQVFLKKKKKHLEKGKKEQNSRNSRHLY
jgi:hypothetical protein